MKRVVFVLTALLLWVGCSSDQPAPPQVVEPTAPTSNRYTGEITFTGEDYDPIQRFDSFEELNAAVEGPVYRLTEAPAVYEATRFAFNPDRGQIFVTYTIPPFTHITIDLTCWQAGFAPHTPLAPASAVEEVSIGRYAAGSWEIEGDISAAYAETGGVGTVDVPYVWNDTAEAQWLRWQQGGQFCQLHAPLYAEDDDRDRVIRKDDLVRMAETVTTVE